MATWLDLLTIVLTPYVIWLWDPWRLKSENNCSFTQKEKFWKMRNCSLTMESSLICLGRVILIRWLKHMSIRGNRERLWMMLKLSSRKEVDKVDRIWEMLKKVKIYNFLIFSHFWNICKYSHIRDHDSLRCIHGNRDSLDRQE